MKYSTALFLFGGLAATVFAQDDSECDPQNDDNNDATCTSSGGAAATETNTNTVTDVNTVTAGSDNPRISSFTDVDTGLVLSTTRDTDVLTTSLPRSIGTFTDSMYNTVTLASTDVYTSLTRSAGGAAATSGSDSDSDNDDSDDGDDSSTTAGAAAGGANSDSSQSTDTDSGAMPTGAAKYIPAGALAAFLGVAAAL